MEITRVKFIAAGAQITGIYYDTYAGVPGKYIANVSERIERI